MSFVIKECRTDKQLVVQCYFRIIKSRQASYHAVSLHQAIFINIENITDEQYKKLLHHSPY